MKMIIEWRVKGWSVKLKQQDEHRCTGINRFPVTNPPVIESEDITLLAPKPSTAHGPESVHIITCFLKIQIILPLKISFSFLEMLFPKRYLHQNFLCIS